LLNWVVNSKHTLFLILSLILAATTILPMLITVLIELSSSVGFLSENQIYRINSLGGAIIEEQRFKRVATWLQTVCMVETSPFIGYPIGSYSQYLPEFFNCAPVSEGVMPHPHSFVLEILVIFGITGGTLLLITLWLLILNANQKNSGNNFSFLVCVGFLSPLNMTHGIVSLWWLFLLSILIGVAIAQSN
ncbi:O-antigen ligase family protein, partial [Paracoccaceae bacterium]|nr:O-antigen ligase family protein [Paracoccaceae bacterium]